MEAISVYIKTDTERSSPSSSPGMPVEKIPKREVGRMVDTTQADDRRMIHLVRERPLLYARTNLPVASYQAQVKTLWKEVADLMGGTVADVRRKWSHIRNSYSRHLRNEIHGVRTGKGRIVSKWYLADELEFLREHMATDARPTPYSMVTSFPPSFLKLERPDPAPWYTLPESSVGASSASEDKPEDDDEHEAYFQFFRGIYKDYRELSPRKQRQFRRQCLIFLHELVDGAEQSRCNSRNEPAPTEYKPMLVDVQCELNSPS